MVKNPYATSWNQVKNPIPDRTVIHTTIESKQFNYGELSAASAINAAIIACPNNGVVLLGPGRFMLDDPINILRSDVTLRGSGPGVTILFKPRTSENQHLVLIGSTMYARTVETTSVNLTKDGVAGEYTIEVANAAGITAGMHIKLDADEWTTAAWWDDAPLKDGTKMKIFGTDRVKYRIREPEQPGGNIPESSLDDYSRYGRGICEVKEVKEVNGNVITFTTPLHIDYPVAKASQVVRYQVPFSKNVGLENLTLTGGTDGNLRVTSTAHSWARNIEASHYGGPCINTFEAFQFALRDSYIHHANNPVPGGGAYAISLRSGVSEALIENNIIMYGNKAMVARGGGSGSVIAYNYAQDTLIAYDLNWSEVGINASHFPAPHHVLFEGNQSNNYDSDFTFGSSIYMTILRNYVEGRRRSFPQPTGLWGKSVRCAGLMQHSCWHIFIGNVLGYPEMDKTKWIYEDMCDGTQTTGNTACAFKGAIWRLGYSSVQSQLSDPKTHQTTIRQGNWDYLTQEVKWDTQEDTEEQDIPNSYYLDEAPDFFGSLTWPWVDSLGDDKLHALPAKIRYENLLNTGVVV